MIIYSGGWNKLSDTSVKASFMYTYHSVIKKAVSAGKKIAMVTLAKPDGYYNFLIDPLYREIVDVIDFTKTTVNWSGYDGIFMPGGNSAPLKEGLLKTGFNLNNLKQNVVVLGDSAGAYVLSSHFYQSPPGDLRGVKIEFLEGLNKQASLITIAHTNNPVYCNETLIKKVEAFAQQNKIKILQLRENEQKTFINGEFTNVDMDSLFLL